MQDGLHCCSPRFIEAARESDSCPASSRRAQCTCQFLRRELYHTQIFTSDAHWNHSSGTIARAIVRFGSGFGSIQKKNMVLVFPEMCQVVFLFCSRAKPKAKPSLELNLRQLNLEPNLKHEEDGSSSVIKKAHETEPRTEPRTKPKPRRRKLERDHKNTKGK
jgi:hypothetical protein